MKKLFILLLPVFVTIAIVFSLRSKEFTFVSFLQFISTLRFDNAFETLLKVGESLNEVITRFKSLSNSSNPLDFIKNIFLSIVNLIKGLALLVQSLFYIVADLINNITSIYSYLFA